MTGIGDGPASVPAIRTAPAGRLAAVCDLCGATAIEVRCKLICRRCGYTRDCSDP